MGETCENCGKRIGDLETPHVFRGHIVCADCDAKLRQPKAVPEPAQARPRRLAEQEVSQEAASLTVHVQNLKGTNGLGIASLVLGIVTSLSCWIPFLGCLGIPITLLGLLFGVLGFLIALLGRRSGIGVPLAGIVVCSVSLFIAIAITGMTGEAMEAAMQETTATRQESMAEEAATRQSTQQPSARRGEDGPPREWWAPADQPVRQGDMGVRIVRVLVGKVPLERSYSEGKTTSAADLLTIELELYNVSKDRKLQYKSWRGADFAFERDYATLEDNFGNYYKRISFGFGVEIVGQTDDVSVYPEKAVRDVLVFELPIDTVEYLKLELPAKNFGGDGMIRLQIPADMVTTR